MYYDHSTCMYCDHNTFLQAVRGAQPPGIAGGLGGAASRFCRGCGGAALRFRRVSGGRSPPVSQGVRGAQPPGIAGGAGGRSLPVLFYTILYVDDELFGRGNSSRIVILVKLSGGFPPNLLAMKGGCDHRSPCNSGRLRPPDPLQFRDAAPLGPSAIPGDCAPGGLAY